MEKPKYLIIKDLILESIDGQKPNTPIQSEREISSKLSASRMTVRRAIEELVSEGILYRDKNKGTYISDKSIHKKGGSLLVEESHQKNITYSILYYDIKSRDEDDVYDKLNMNYDDQYLRLVRLQTSEDIPTSVEEIYISRKNLSDEDLKVINKDLDLEEYINDGILNQVFHPMIVPTQYANLLKMKIGEPLIRVDSLISLKNGHPYVFVKSYYNPKHKRIEMTV